jgi:hypothetical protein
MQHKQPSTPAQPSAHGLTRSQVARQLGTTVTTVHRMRLRGELRPQRDTAGVYHYDPADVIRAAAARSKPNRYTPGQIAARAFQMFDQGGELKDIVMALGAEEAFARAMARAAALIDPEARRQKR